MPDVFTELKDSAESPWKDIQLSSISRGQSSLTPGGLVIRIPGSQGQMDKSALI